jgi:hypothetical protein
VLAVKVETEQAMRAAHEEERRNEAGYDVARMTTLGVAARTAQNDFFQFVVDHPQFRQKQGRPASRAGKRQAAERRAIDGERQRQARARSYYR